MKLGLAAQDSAKRPASAHCDQLRGTDESKVVLEMWASGPTDNRPVTIDRLSHTR